MTDDVARIASAAVAIRDAMGTVAAPRRGMNADSVYHLARSSKERRILRDQLLTCIDLLDAASKDLSVILGGHMK